MPRSEGRWSQLDAAYHEGIRGLLGSRGSRELHQGALPPQLASELFKFMGRFSHPDFFPQSPAPCRLSVSMEIQELCLQTESGAQLLLTTSAAAPWSEPRSLCLGPSDCTLLVPGPAPAPESLSPPSSLRDPAEIRTWIKICCVCQYFSTLKNQSLRVLPLRVRGSCQKAHGGDSVKRGRNLEDPSPCVSAARHPRSELLEPFFLSGDALETSWSRGCKLAAKHWMGLRERMVLFGPQHVLKAGSACLRAVGGVKSTERTAPHCPAASRIQIPAFFAWTSVWASCALHGVPPW
ncbi:uncharacterized protein LOC123816831 [Phyllostomus hastatus]|uniref:uncharacterized protein LOC123816831 n=1 Tax=Phyllostomus hastatus TaxID=9423 RepID=UPI001E682A53|nr:uncharacterized protein LOC123816831 [Phyllostomus hastatus]